MRTIVPALEFKYSNIKVNIKERLITLDVRNRKPNGKRWSKKETITAKISSELYAWLMFKSVNHNGVKITPFQKYLVNREIQFKPGILNSMEFESNNLSESYKENPFKILSYDDGAYSITLCHIKRKIKDQNGNWKEQSRKYYSKFCFRRFIQITNL